MLAAQIVKLLLTFRYSVFFLRRDIAQEKESAVKSLDLDPISLFQSYRKISNHAITATVPPVYKCDTKVSASASGDTRSTFDISWVYRHSFAANVARG